MTTAQATLPPIYNNDMEDSDWQLLGNDDLALQTSQHQPPASQEAVNPPQPQLEQQQEQQQQPQQPQETTEVADVSAYPLVHTIQVLIPHTRSFRGLLKRAATSFAEDNRQMKESFGISLYEFIVWLFVGYFVSVRPRNWEFSFFNLCIAGMSSLFIAKCPQPSFISRQALVRMSFCAYASTILLYPISFVFCTRMLFCGRLSEYVTKKNFVSVLWIALVALRGTRGGVVNFCCAFGATATCHFQLAFLASVVIYVCKLPNKELPKVN